MARTLKYLANLPMKGKREREVEELMVRLMDPEDPYRDHDDRPGATERGGR